MSEISLGEIYFFYIVFGMLAGIIAYGFLDDDIDIIAAGIFWPIVFVSVILYLASRALRLGLSIIMKAFRK